MNKLITVRSYTNIGRFKEIIKFADDSDIIVFEARNQCEFQDVCTKWIVGFHCPESCKSRMKEYAEEIIKEKEKKFE